MNALIRTYAMLIPGLTVLLVSPVAAQDEDRPTRQPDSDIQFSFSVDAQYQFEADIDGGSTSDSGDFAVWRVDGALAARMELTPTLEMTLRVGYMIEDYDFNDEGLVGIRTPWDDVHTVDVSAMFSYEANNEWTVFGGPILRFARESGADWGDSIIGGGFVGASVRLNEDLLIGAGIGIVTEIEDSVRLFPVIVIDWLITDTLRLSNAVNDGGQGIELIWQPGGDWEFGIGASYRYSRFRLDDSTGPQDEGVGQDESLPIIVRATYTFSPNISVSAYGGAVFAGELRLEDDDGDRIQDEDYDPAGLLGVSARIRF
jgi:hypothetical protein